MELMCELHFYRDDFHYPKGGTLIRYGRDLAESYKYLVGTVFTVSDLT
jgi:hypothetical protein